MRLVFPQRILRRKSKGEIWRIAASGIAATGEYEQEAWNRQKNALNPFRQDDKQHKTVRKAHELDMSVVALLFLQDR